MDGIHLWLSAIQAIDLSISRYVQQFLVCSKIVREIRIGLTLRRSGYWSGQTFKNDDITAVRIVPEVLRLGKVLILVAVGHRAPVGLNQFIVVAVFIGN